MLSTGGPGETANPQETPGQGTASLWGITEGHQGHPAATGPTLTNPASSAKGPGAMGCWDLTSGGLGARRHPGARDELGTAEGQQDSRGRKEASMATDFLLWQVTTLFPTVIKLSVRFM